jgi:2OG-Fe(II) oxygenase superfamily
MSDLAHIFANRAWLRREWPFPHVTARNVFKSDFYNALALQLTEILDRGLSETPAGGRLSRNIAAYDAYGIGISPRTSGPASTLLSPAWRDMMCALFGIGPTPYVFAGVHYHAVGSKSGFVHNDFNPVWFPRANGDRMQSSEAERCAYKTGAGPLKDPDKIEVVRAAVVILFVSNGKWRSGDGGETGLYSSSHAAVSEPSISYPPENNSLLAFECTPRSYHTFISNVRLPRMSLIMWIHRTMQEATEKFGADHLERWNG